MTWPQQFGLVTAIAFGATVGNLHAQTPAEVVLTGTVLDSISQNPVASALLSLPNQSKTWRTSENGRFEVSIVVTTAESLLVRVPGFIPATVPLKFGLAVDGRLALGAIALQRAPTPLERIEVVANTDDNWTQLADFNRRKRQGLPGGVYVTRTEIERVNARSVTEVLRRTPKVEVDCSASRFGDDRCVPRNRRGRNVRVPTPGLIGSTYRDVEAGAREENGATRCEMNVFVDGLPSKLPINDIPVSTIAGIEIYSGAATTPASFGAVTCGVIAIWTAPPPRQNTPPDTLPKR